MEYLDDSDISPHESGNSLEYSSESILSLSTEGEMRFKCFDNLSDSILTRTQFTHIIRCLKKEI